MGLVGTNNLSTAIIIMGIAVILVFTASPKYLQFIAMGGLGVGFLAIFLSVESYRLERLAIWRNRRPTKRAIRRFRDFMPSAPAACLAWDMATVCRSWDLCRRLRMI